MSKFEKVKVGDKIVYGGWGGDSVETVERITKAFFFTKNRKFNMDGHCGSGYDRIYARPATEKDIIKFKVRMAQKKLESVVVTSESLELTESFLCDMAALAIKGGA